MFRKFLRYGFSGLLFVLAALLVQAVETTSEQLGFVAMVKRATLEGIQGVVDWGYATWLLNGILVCSGAALALWIDYFIRKRTTVTIPKKSAIHTAHKGKCFRNCKIILDGNSYRNCEFYNVTFVYNGGKMELRDNIIEGTILSSEIKEMQDFLMLAGHLGMFKVPLYIDGKEKNFEIKPNTQGTPYQVDPETGAMVVKHSRGPISIIGEHFKGGLRVEGKEEIRDKPKD